MDDVARGVTLDGVARFAVAGAGADDSAGVVGSTTGNVDSTTGVVDSTTGVGDSITGDDAPESAAVVRATDAASVFAGRFVAADLTPGLAGVVLAAAVFDAAGVEPAAFAAVVFVVREAGFFGVAFTVALDSPVAALVSAFDALGSAVGSGTGWVCKTWLAAVFARAAAAVEGRRGVVFRGALTVLPAVASGSSCSGGGGAELTQLTYQDGRVSACLEGNLPQIRSRKPLRGRSRVDNDIRHLVPLEGVAG
ncbi:MAG: hypothetical protein QOF36_43 [Microbacteriaceae bacterium]|nr:hypothetical protein [Microbacteriaceae bacterium]